jgi:alkylation response protein AidB-like acyl-CoA dehydrogenase
VNFAFSEEQEQLRAQARRFLERQYPIDRVAAIADGDGFPRDEWRKVVELGWTAISLPEDLDGAGLGFLEELIVAEEMGRALYPGPYFSSVILGLGALRWGGVEGTREVASGSRIATVAWAGEDGRFGVDPAPKAIWDEPNGSLTATKLFVPDLEVADLIAVVGEAEGKNHIWVLEDPNGPGVRRRAMPAVDSTRRMGELVLENAAGYELLHSEEPPSLGELRDRALAGLAAEAVGAGARALELGIEHARTRQQFGRPIGVFQAVSHQLAQAFLEIETARSLAYWAGWAVSEGAPEASLAAATAKARAAEAAVAACERAIQVHGGIGFTWEHPLHRYYKRALGISALFGWGSELRSAVAAQLLDDGNSTEAQP